MTAQKRGSGARTNRAASENVDHDQQIDAAQNKPAPLPEQAPPPISQLIRGWLGEGGDGSET